MAWLRLLRIANLPSAISNILVGFLLANSSWQPSIELFLLILSSASLYCAGMVLNDVFDFDRDLQERPERPLPSGQIDRRLARIVGFGLLVDGVILALVAGYLSSGSSGAMLTGGVATVLAICVYLYDGPLKRTPIAPWLMGFCRTLNILLGASTVSAVVIPGSGEPVVAAWAGAEIPNIVYWVAVSVGILIAGVTLLARNEAQEKQSRPKLMFASLVIFAGLVGLATAVYCPQPGIELSRKVSQFFPFVIAVVSITVLRRTLIAASTGDAKSVQTAVVAILKSLILFDACVTLLACGDNFFYPLVVVGHLIPALFVGRWIRGT
jgi:4-hydroxybenzoate polyprenyltransferase